MAKQKQIRCYCDQCNRETNHSILFSIERKSEPDEESWWRSTYSTVQCLGCDNIQFHKEDEDESCFEPAYDGNMISKPTISVFPSNRKKVNPLNDIWHLPRTVGSLYRETVDCLNNGGLQLAAAGFRATIEAICVDAKIDGKTLEAKINNMAKSHLITAADRDNLHAIRFIGNDSIHGIKKYSQNEVVIVAHIVNSILTSHYLIANEVKNWDIKPVKTYEEFEEILLERIKEQKIGKVDILKNFIDAERRIIKEDMPKFEMELQKRISANEFTKLSLCPVPNQGCRQQYKVES